MNINPIWIMLPAVFVIDAVIIWAVFNGLRGDWRDFERRFPPRPATGAAVRREFQSLRIGLYNLGGCVHLAADEGCLHFQPSRFLRMFGYGMFSVPWEEMLLIKRHKHRSKVRIGPADVWGPTWALELAPVARGSA